MPQPLKPVTLREIKDAHKRSSLSYLTFGTKLNCSAKDLRDIQMGLTSDGDLFNRYLALLRPFFRIPKKISRHLKDQGLDPSELFLAGTPEPVTPVFNDAGEELFLPASIKYIPRSQGGGLDPNRPRRNTLRRPDHNPDNFEVGETPRPRTEKDVVTFVQEVNNSGPIPTPPDIKPARVRRPQSQGYKPRKISNPNWGRRPNLFHGLSLDQVAQQWDCSYSAISRVKNGRITSGPLYERWQAFIKDGIALSPPEPEPQNV